MKHLIKVLIAFCLFGFGIPIRAQYSIPATGGNATGTGGTGSYTIGQVVYSSIAETSGFITQGVQQPFEITVITAIEEASGIILESSVYPNPANDFMILKVKNYDNVDLSYKLFGINGILIQGEKVEGEEIQIPMGNVVSGTYLLKIIDNNKEIKTFKIIKK